MSEPKDQLDAAKPNVLFAVDGCVMGHCQDVIVIVWGIDVTPSLIDEYSKLLTYVATTQRRFSIVHVAPTLKNLPGGELRAAFAAIAEKHVNEVLLTAVLIVGSGFWSSAVRGVITSVQVLLRRKLNTRVCGSVDEVVTWLAPEHSSQTGKALDTVQLRAAIEQMIDHPSVRHLVATLR
jgi:hypothetical protein